MNEGWEEQMKRATAKMIDAGFWKKLYGERSRSGREVPRRKEGRNNTEEEGGGWRAGSKLIALKQGRM